jgi:hypothetical protein
LFTGIESGVIRITAIWGGAAKRATDAWGLQCDSEQLTVGTMLRETESWTKKVESSGQIAHARTGSTAGLTAGGLGWRRQDQPMVLLARKLAAWNQKRRQRQVESEAVEAPIIRGILAIESEETL